MTYLLFNKVSWRNLEMNTRNPIARDLRTPKYRKRVIQNERKEKLEELEEKEMKEEEIEDE